MAEEYKNPDTGQEEMEDTAQIPVEDQKAEEEIQAEDCGNSDSGDTEQTAGNAEADAKAGTTDKKVFFSKNQKADKEKAGMQEKIDSLEDRVRRQMAEFDNYRKRTDKEKEQMFSMGERSVIEKILPIVDNFERGFDTVDESDKDDAFVIGMQKIYTQLTTQLEALGVKPIEAVGKEFDPNMHNAVMQVESQEYESGTVAQELLKGYMYHDQVLRHSMVAVVQ